jgi:hypothetical protein
MTGMAKTVPECVEAIDRNPTVPLMVISPFGKVQVLFGMKKIDWR